MNIAIIGSVTFDSLEFHLCDELNEQGENVKIFDIRKFLPNKIDFGVSQIFSNYVQFKFKLIFEQVVAFSPELVICVYRHIEPNFVRLIKEMGIKIIHINPDAITTFQSQQLFVEPYDAYFTKDPFILSFMTNKLGLNAFHYYEAFNTRFHAKPDGLKEEFEKNSNIDVLAYGTVYPYRARFLKTLEDNGINLKIYGRRAKYVDDFNLLSFTNNIILGKEKAQLIYSSRIVVNNFHYAEIESVNNKFFEIFGCGGFQICDYKNALNDILPIDPKLISFNNLDEARGLILYYLNNPDRRLELQKGIYPYIFDNFSYRSMLKKIFNQI